MNIIYPRIPINSNVEINKERYRVEQWHHKNNITYEFIYIGENGKFNFEKSQEDVAIAIKDNIIKFIS